MKKHTVFFRADGNTVAGYGHVLRSLALASMLVRKYNCIFIIRDPDEFLLKQIKKVCSEAIIIPAAVSVTKELQVIGRRISKEDITVLDGYKFDTAYQEKIKRKCFRLVSIDDIYSTHFVSHALINHAGGIRKEQYSAASYTRFYLGSEYAILRKPFLRSALGTSLPEQSEKGRVFISLGGTDQQNFASKAVSLCLKTKSIDHIDLVIGSYYPYREQLMQMQKANPQVKIRIHSGLSAQAVCNLMRRSEAAICSASTVSYEYATVGGILFVFRTVDNQADMYRFLVKTGSAYPAEKLKNALELLRDKQKRKAYFSQRQRYFQGDSEKRLRAVFERFETERGLKMRKATAQDALTYFKWVNDPEVRKNSVQTAPVQLESHVSWFRRKIKNRNSFLYIFEKNGDPLGQVRLDGRPEQWEIDYSIGKRYRGYGYGKIILQMAMGALLAKYPGTVFLAYVKTENTASNKVFENLGFRRFKTAMKGGSTYHYYRFGNKLS